MSAVGTEYAMHLPTMDLPGMHKSSMSSVDRTGRHGGCVLGLRTRVEISMPPYPNVYGRASCRGTSFLPGAVA